MFLLSTPNILARPLPLLTNCEAANMHTIPFAIVTLDY